MVGQRCKSAAPFSTLDDGRFHLKGGVSISKEHRSGIYGNASAAKVAKDAVQVLWGSEMLTRRTYVGKLALKDWKNLGASVRKEPTPKKVDLVFGKNIDTLGSDEKQWREQWLRQHEHDPV